MTIEVVSPSDTALLAELVALGDTASGTLGMLRPAVYADAAHKGFLLLARHEDKIAGYALYRCPRTEVVLTHLCVDRRLRKMGIARSLVEEVSNRTQARMGIRAKCRNDYQLDQVWRSLGFDALGKARGRGADEAPMTVWWRDHAHQNLFTPVADEQPVALPVAVDVNILMDLHTRVGTAVAARSQALMAPDLSDRMELVVPPGLERDLARHPEGHRARLVTAASQYMRPEGDPVRARSLFDTISATVRETLPDFPASDTDVGDVWQIAETAAAGVRVFVTWDNRLRNVIGPIVARIDRPELKELRIIDPDHLVIHLDELAHAALYRPAALEGTHFSVAPAGTDAESAVLPFLGTSSGETKTQLRQRLSDISKSPRSLMIVRDEGNPVACYASATEGHALRVRLLRVAEHRDAETMARRLLWLLREKARAEGVNVVAIDDTHLSPIAQRAAVYESYERVGDRWLAWVIDECGTGIHLSSVVSTARELMGLGPASLLTPGLAPEIAAQYERTWWPAKLTDSTLPHFAVAIKPHWSAGLFGVPQILTERPTELALGREQVYYHSGQPSVLRAPGRILWFLSQAKEIRPGRTHDARRTSRFIGTSLLDAIELGTPEDLYAALRHYGVYTLDNVRGAVDKRGLVQALRISDTELFPHPVPWDDYLPLRERLGGPKQILAPTNLPSRTFAAVYDLGTRSGVSNA